MKKRSNEIGIIFIQILFIAILIVSFKYITRTSCFASNQVVVPNIAPTVKNLSSKDQNNIESSKDHLNNESVLMLVNKSHALSENYVPRDLVKVKVNFYKSASDQEKMLNKEAAKALEELFKSAHKDGIELYGLSGYRSFSTQQSLYVKACLEKGKKKADKQVAKGGFSEHQTGLAMDVTNKNYSPSFEITKEGKWLYKNCYKSGFILRYPLNKQSITGYNYEPWHIRYVGITVAKEIFSKNIVLEEYLNK